MSLYHIPRGQGAHCFWQIPQDCHTIVFQSSQLTEIVGKSFKAFPPSYEHYMTNITLPGDGVHAACINAEGEQGQWSVKQCEPAPPAFIPAPEPDIALLLMAGIVMLAALKRYRL